MGAYEFNPFPTISFITDSMTITEGQNALITLTLDFPYTDAVSVDLTTGNLIAIAGEDYIPLTQTVTFPAGTIPHPLLLAITDDLLDERTETFQLTLTNPQNAQLTTPATIILTILDNDEAAAPSSHLRREGLGVGVFP